MVVVSGALLRLKESRLTEIMLLICGICSRADGVSGSSVIGGCPNASQVLVDDPERVIVLGAERKECRQVAGADERFVHLVQA